MSIIDYLQLWNLNKKAERYVKTKFLSKNGEQLSAIEPVRYKNRFLGIIRNRILTLADETRMQFVPNLMDEL